MWAITWIPYGWDFRNIAKTDQGTANCELFQFCHTLSTRFERNFLQPFYTLWGTYVCNVINIVWLGFEKHSRNWPRNSQLWTFSFFFKNCRNDSNENFDIHFTLYGGPMWAITWISCAWDLRNIAKTDQGTANCELFQFCQRLSTGFERNFLQLSYTLWVPMCAMTSIFYDWDLRNIAKIDQGTVNYELFHSILFQKLS